MPQQGLAESLGFGVRCPSCDGPFSEINPRFVTATGWSTLLCMNCVVYCFGCADIRSRRSVRPFTVIPVTGAARPEWAVGVFINNTAEGCEECSSSCSECDDHGLPGDFITAQDVRGVLRVVCENCYTTCIRCGTFVVLGAIHCRRCVLTVENPEHIKHQYSYKPKAKFHGAMNNPYPGLFIGIEQELEPRVPRNYRSALNTASELANRHDPTGLLYFKDDGSLDNGVEIVSHPMSIPYFMEEYPWELWKPGVGIGTVYKQTSHTGVHIHVSKAAFSRAHAYRFNAFHFLNPDFVELIAGRRSNHYTKARPEELNRLSVYNAQSLRYERIGREKQIISVTSSVAKDKYRSYNRYWAVNPTNDETYELRYFRSTVDAKRLRFYGEWMEALFLYTQQGWIRTRHDERRLTPRNMHKWVEAQPSGKFPQLAHFLASKESELSA